MENKVKKYLKLLTSTDYATLEKIKQFEKEGKLNNHLDSNPESYLPVDEKFEYLPKNIFVRFDRFLKRKLFVDALMHETNKLFQTEVVGKENIKDIDCAIVCSNHINKLDSLAIQFALKPHKTYFTAAEFNNMSGFVGEMMRADRMLPMSSNIAAQRNFLKTISELMKKKCYVTFFPEGSEWWCYEKPRPQLNGAYNVAVKNGVPVIPIFITFKQTEASRKSPLGLKKFIINILKPIYPDSMLSLKQNIEQMKASCEKCWQETYNKFYKIEDKNK